MLDNKTLQRVTRDITNGLMVLDMHGNVSFVNPAAMQILEKEDISIDEITFSELLKEINPQNDILIEFLLDAIYDKEKTHEGTIKYVTSNGRVKWIHMTTSFLFSEDGKQKEGVLAHFSDVTDIHNLEQKTHDSAFVFVIMMAGVSLWTFVYLVWLEMGEPVSSSALTKVVELSGFVIFFILYKYTSITLSDMGLSFKNAGKYILIDSLFTLALFAVAVVIKLVLLNTSPEMFDNKVLFDLSVADWSYYIYPITVFIQEFLTRGVIQESVKRILPGKSSDFWAIIVSSLFFAALHIHKGIFYMIGAFGLLSVFGIVYKKQKTIWGLCVPHFVLGTFIFMLFPFL